MNLSTTNINNADPGYNFGFIYGNQNGDNRFTISYEYEEIGRLMNIDLGLVDWSTPATWPLGFSSFGNLVLGIQYYGKFGFCPRC